MADWKIVETHVLPLGWAGHIKITGSEENGSAKRGYSAELCLAEMSPIQICTIEHAGLEVCKEKALAAAKRTLLDIQRSIELELEAVDKLLAGK